MFGKLIFSILLLSCVGCASQLKSKEPLPVSFGVKTYNSKKEIYEDHTATAEKLEKADGSYYLKVSAGSSYNTFSANHAEEYIYYIDKYLKSDNLLAKSEIYLGDAHTFSPLARNKLSVVFSEEELLRVEPCSFGHCNGHGVLFYDRSSIENLRTYISEFQKKYQQPEPVFQAQSPSSGKALVYFYRLNTSPLGSKAPVKINGKEKLKLAVNTCFAMELDPGKYEVSVDMSMVTEAEKTFEFEADKSYFVKYSSIMYSEKRKPDYAVNAMLKVFYDRNSLKVEPQVVAQYDISECELLESN